MDQIQKFETKPAEPEMPWVGTYFDIPEPEGEKIPDPELQKEFELHLLLKNLSVRKLKLRCNPQDPSGGWETLRKNFLQIAYDDEGCIAFILYDNAVEAVSGKVLKVAVSQFPTMRTGQFKWKQYDKGCRNPMIEQEFVIFPTYYKRKYE